MEKNNKTFSKKRLKIGGYGVALVIAAIVAAIGGNGWNAVLLVGGSIVCAGCAILFYLGCKYATKGAIWLSKQIVVGIKKCFVKKENV